jgi:hypothetical protein
MTHCHVMWYECDMYVIWHWWAPQWMPLMPLFFWDEVLVEGLFVPNISRQYGDVIKGCHWYFNPWRWDPPIMSRNIGHQLQSSLALHHRRMKISAMVRKPKNYTIQFTFACHNNMVGVQTFEVRATLRCGSTVITNTDHLEKPSEKRMCILSW